MSESIKYNKGILTLINQLSNINSKLVIKKSEEEDNITIDAKTASGSVAYSLKAPIEVFDFDGNDISFFDYRDFFRMFSVYDEPAIKQNENMFEISKERSKMTYPIAEKEAVEIDDYDYIEFEEYQAKFNLTAEHLKKFKQMTPLIKAEDLIFKVRDDKVIITLYYEKDQPTYEEEFDLSEKASKDFDIVVSPDVIKFAPENDYEIELNEIGIIKFEYLNKNNITLNLYVAENEDE